MSLDNLFLAWREFKRGKTRKVETQEFEFNLEDNIFQLHQELVDKTYNHAPYQAFYVCDPKLRHIHKAGVRDRVVHQALYRILYHIFNKQFIYDSYSCRIGKGTHKGVKRLGNFVLRASLNYSQKIYALKCDIKKFFNNIDHKILLALLENRVEEVDVMWLIKKIINSFSSADNKGLPLGNVTSQLFGNIYLNELDQFVKHGLKQKFYIRYCDDFIILHKDKGYLANILKELNTFLKDQLRLDIHPGKISIRKVSQGIDFLGYVTLPHYRVLRTKTKRRILRLVNKNNAPSYLGVLKHANTWELRKELLSKIFLFDN
ncbi:MAG: hypothetical protein C3F02_02930 [Parcubacteria group bacterium]|nr:MAG: hypothetical protein C3F02_02930 [Parcubacteria group bacterium]